MNLLFKIIAITSIWCLGLTIITQPEMGLHKIRAWAEGKNDKGYKITEPFILCVWCMASIHSLVGYAFAYGLGFIKVIDFKLLVMLPLVICGASMLNGFTWGILTMVMNINKYYEGVQEPNDERVIDDEPKESY